MEEENEGEEKTHSNGVHFQAFGTEKWLRILNEDENLQKTCWAEDSSWSKLVLVLVEALLLALDSLVRRLLPRLKDFFISSKNNDDYYKKLWLRDQDQGRIMREPLSPGRASEIADIARLDPLKALRQKGPPAITTMTRWSRRKRLMIALTRGSSSHLGTEATSFHGSLRVGTDLVKWYKDHENMNIFLCMFNTNTHGTTAITSSSVMYTNTATQQLILPLWKPKPD